MRYDSTDNPDAPGPPPVNLSPVSSAGGTAGRGWRYMLLGAALALVFSFGLGALASLSASVSMGVMLGVLAYLLAGLVPGVIQPRRDRMSPRDPAIGAGLVAALIAFVQLTAVHRRFPEVPPGRLLLSAVLSIALGFGLTWIGSRLGSLLAASRVRARSSDEDPRDEGLRIPSSTGTASILSPRSSSLPPPFGPPTEEPG